MAPQVWYCKAHPRSRLVIDGNERNWRSAMDTTCFLGATVDPRQTPQRGRCVFVEEETAP